MIKDYKVLDMSVFYEGVYEQHIYLIFSSDLNNANISKKIKISNRRFFNINYAEDEEVQVLIKDKNSNKYSIKNVPVKDGKYRLDLIVTKMFLDAEPVTSEDWDFLCKFYHGFFEVITLADNVVVIRGSTWQMNAIMSIEMENSDLFLEKIECKKKDRSGVERLFDKCIYGDDICLADFYSLIDDLEESEFVTIEFNAMIFSVDAEKILVRMFIGTQDDIYEEFSFTISSGRVGGMNSFLFDKLAERESIEKKMKFLSDKIFY